jgi:hypothetical protein
VPNCRWKYSPFSKFLVFTSIYRTNHMPTWVIFAPPHASFIVFIVHDLQLLLLPQHVHHRECAQWHISLLHHLFIVTANQALISFECYILVLLCCIICLMLNSFFCLCTHFAENTETKLTKATRMWHILRVWFINSITYREPTTIKRTLTIGSLKCRSVFFPPSQFQMQCTHWAYSHMVMMLHQNM